MCGLIAFAMVLMQMPLYGQKKLIVNQLKCEQQENPIGIDTPTPRFSWQLWAVDRGIDQTAYRIIVADSPEAIGRGEGTMWDSKKVVSEESLLVSYAGKPLEAGQQ